MSAHHDDQDDLNPTFTSGYRPGAKKSAAELAQLDAQDESLQKWKASLGLKAAGTSDRARVIIESMSLEVPDRADVVMRTGSEEDLKRLTQISMTIKEGVEYRLKVKFRVEGDVVSGLKYLHLVKRMGMKVDRTEEMLGSYGPAPQPYEKKFLPEEAPKGMTARGHYNVQSRFVDDDNVTHLLFNWSFDIKKDWD
ncbi:immunoglobulin E-set [Cladochytrium replicatum]|nr:immunoglobulin E-set [Cladochytrium replicatum]